MSGTSAIHVRKHSGISWSGVLRVLWPHLLALAAPWYFSWSGLAVCVVLYLISGLGVSVGFHRLLTHRSFATPKPIQWLLGFCGSLSNQGGVIEWVATHRLHHAHADKEGDPHTPTRGFWAGHVSWLFDYDERVHTHAGKKRFAKDLCADPVFLTLEYGLLPLQVCIGLALYFVGEKYFGQGTSWVVWGLGVRIVALFHVTWLVNSACHRWGYQNFATKDQSRNLWWVAILSFGEGWHNNHHGEPLNPSFQQKWWEIDPGAVVVSLLNVLRLGTRRDSDRAKASGLQQFEEPGK